MANMSLLTVNTCEAHTLWLLKYEVWVDDENIEKFARLHEYERKSKFIETSQ
jgi:hypothetical protein